MRATIANRARVSFDGVEGLTAGEWAEMMPIAPRSGLGSADQIATLPGVNPSPVSPRRGSTQAFG